MSIINCPTCGAKADSVVANCEYCGIEFAKAQSVTPQEFITAVARAINTYTFRHEGITIVPIPNDVPTLMSFFIYCHGNISYNPDYFSDPDQEAWRSKAKASFEMLRLASSENPKISKFLSQYERIYSEEGMEKTLKIGQEAARKNRIKDILLILSILSSLFAVWVMIYYFFEKLT